MRSWWSPLSRRLSVVRDVHRRGDMPLFLETFCVALAVPLLMRLPLPRIEALLEWSAAGAAAGRRADPDALCAKVLEMLQTTQPIVRRGCLTRGVTLYYALRRAGVDVSLAFGMGAASRGDGFDGHCWLVRDGEPYLERRDPRGEYALMYTFRGRRAGDGLASVAE